MEKEFIPYNLALELRDLGLDEPCFGYYRSKDNFQLFDKRNIVGSNKDIYKTEYVKAPLWQQAFQFFREKYGYFESYDFDHGDDTKNNRGFWFCIINTQDRDFWYDITDDKIPYYKTYEEARLECLKKLIEIVKNK